MSESATVSTDTLPATWEDDATFRGAVERFKSLRLFSLLNDPGCFGSTYSKEVEYPDSRWQEKLQSPDVFHVIASLPVEDQDMTGQRSFPEGNWIGMVVPRRVKQESTAQLEDGLYVITGMFVRPEVRGMGVGAKLVKHALEVITADRKQRREAAARVELTVDTDNVAAIALYKSCGFCIWKETSAEKATSGRQEVGMYITLGR